MRQSIGWAESPWAPSAEQTHAEDHTALAEAARVEGHAPTQLLGCTIRADVRASRVPGRTRRAADTMPRCRSIIRFFPSHCIVLLHVWGGAAEPHLRAAGDVNAARASKPLAMEGLHDAEGLSLMVDANYNPFYGSRGRLEGVTQILSEWQQIVKP